jgi:hypothetical protein
MSLLRRMFGPSRDEVWRQLSQEMNGRFTQGTWGKGSKVEVRVHQWTITLDTYVVSTGKSAIVFTRMRAPYVNADSFRFTVFPQGFFAKIGKMFGMQDVEVGFEEFDKSFVIKGTDETRLRQLFANRGIRELIQQLKNFHLEVKDDEGYFGSDFPEGVDELWLQILGVIKDREQLRNMFDLFAAVLDHLCEIGSAYKRDPHVELK